MRIFYVIIVIFCCALKASAAEPPKLTFLPDGATEYVKEKTPSGSYIEVLRPLKEFKVGKKYCLWGSDNWDDACQDAAMEYAYGSRWPEFKRVAVEFLELTKQDKLAETAKLFEFEEPTGACITYIGDRMSTTRVKDARELEYYTSVKHLKLWRDKSNAKTYRELLIDPCLTDNRYCTFLSKDLAIEFDFDYREELNKYSYLPKNGAVYIFGVKEIKSRTEDKIDE
jgi:hypothetical protein